MHRIFDGKIIFYLLFLTVLDISLTPVMAVAGAQPILSYLMILYVSLHWNWDRTWPIAVMVGLARDLTSAHPFGIETVSLFLVAKYLDFVTHKLERRSFFFQWSASFTFVCFANIAILLLTSFLASSNYVTWFSLWICFASSVYTACLMPIFFLFTNCWFHEQAKFKQYELFT